MISVIQRAIVFRSDRLRFSLSGLRIGVDGCTRGHVCDAFAKRKCAGSLFPLILLLSVSFSLFAFSASAQVPQGIPVLSKSTGGQNVASAQPVAVVRFSETDLLTVSSAIGSCMLQLLPA